MRRALLALLVLTGLPGQAAGPVRLQVIPYQVRSKEIRVQPFLVSPPPVILEEAKTEKRKPTSTKARARTWEDDAWWLEQ